MKKLISLLLISVLLIQVAGPINAAAASVTAGEESFYHEEIFIDNEGKENKLVYQGNKKTVESELYIEGELKQKTTLNRDTGNMTTKESEKLQSNNTHIDDIVEIETIDEGEDESNNFDEIGINTIGDVIAQKYSSQWNRTGYLYRDITTTQGPTKRFTFSYGTTITAIATAVVDAFLIPKAINGNIIALLTGLGVNIVSGVIQESLSTTFGQSKTIHRFQVWANNIMGLEREKEYRTIWVTDNYTGDREYNNLGQTSGSNETYDEMLDAGIYYTVIYEN